MRRILVALLAIASTLALAGCPGGVAYRNCDDARAHSAAPLHKGEPGYSRDLDRDGDGTACD